MTTRQALLLDLLSIIAIGVGVYVGTKGRMLWLVVLVPLVLVAPFAVFHLMSRHELAESDDQTRHPPAA